MLKIMRCDPAVHDWAFPYVVDVVAFWRRICIVRLLIPLAIPTMRTLT